MAISALAAVKLLWIEHNITNSIYSWVQKNTPKKLEILPAKENFNSRFALGFGNYNNLILDYGSSVSLDKRQNVDWFIFYDGLLKNINDFSIDTKQSNFNVNISHQFSTSKRNSFSQINFRQHRQSFMDSLLL